MKRALSALLAAVLAVAPVFANVKDLKGFDKKVYDGAFALYASSHSLGIRDRFICTAQAVKADGHGGYILLSAGHCTTANPEMPRDLEFSVAEDLGGSLMPVVLLQSAFEDYDKTKTRLDFAEFYLRTDKKYPVTQLGDENDARLEDPTVNVNFSLELNKFVSLGHVSGKVEANGDMVNEIAVDQFSSHGASGSSVVDKRTKKVIGILVAGVDGTTTAAWVEPISRIKKFLNRATLPRDTKPYVAPQHEQYAPDADDVVPPLPDVPETAPLPGCSDAVQARIVNGQVVAQRKVVACLSEDGHWFDPYTGEVF